VSRQYGSPPATPPMHPVHRGHQGCWEGPPPTAVTSQDRRRRPPPAVGWSTQPTLSTPGPTLWIYSAYRALTARRAKKCRIRSELGVQQAQCAMWLHSCGMLRVGCCTQMGDARSGEAARSPCTPHPMHTRTRPTSYLSSPQREARRARCALRIHGNVRAQRDHTGARLGLRAQRGASCHGAAAGGGDTGTLQ